MTMQLPPGVSLGDVPAGGVLADSDWYDEPDDFEPVSFAPKAVNGRIKIRLADLVKVGPEGYIHGYICVRPPCGEAVEAEFSSKTGEIRHDDIRVMIFALAKCGKTMTAPTQCHTPLVR
jgi:hypothetical protein